MRALGVAAAALGVTALPRAAAAASFDELGQAQLEPDAVATESFEVATPPITCTDDCSFQVFDGPDAVTGDAALAGNGWVRLSSGQASFEVDLVLPDVDASYRFRLWVRHARARVRLVVTYRDGRPNEAAYLFPSGRVTSDGWVELESNPVSITGPWRDRTFVRVDGTNVDVDAIEAVPEGDYDPGSACLGAFDPICGPEAVCIAEQCRQGARFVPPLPEPQYREAMAGYLMGRVRWLFGGKLSRARSMPPALAEMQKMLTAATPWEFWGSFARGVRMLSDWHTSVGSAIESSGSDRHLSVCFIEGHADLSQVVWPSQPGRMDVLVSHVGADGTLGLQAGDRLVAVDGMHPLDWARSLAGAAWGWHVATDPDVDADLAESLRGLIPSYARSFSVVRCDAASAKCSDTIETFGVADIPSGGSGPGCDNRPLYHLQNPPDANLPANHYLPFVPWRDLVTDSQPGENIWGMTFDNLYGTDQGLTPFFLESNQIFHDQARGVILDHRAGNGGTIDAPQAITQLVRTPLDLSVSGFMSPAGDDGPANQAQGVLRFEHASNYSSTLVYRVGSDEPDLDLPVALITHRDGSASDWLPHGMKGAPNVRIFGPHETAGAFSSFYQYAYWSRIDFQLASGDTIDYQGNALLGHGIEPDEIVLHTQTSLLAGQDAPYEAALAWVRSRLK